MRDIDIRRALLRKVKAIHLTEPDTLFVEELGLCQGASRIDLAVVNGKLHGYEIKSERDTLLRLPSQRDAYCDALEFVTIVAAESHLPDVCEMVPDWWGVWSAKMYRGKAVLKEERKASRNPVQNRASLVQLLWRDEVLAALASRGFTSGFKSKTRTELWGHLAGILSCEELGDVVRHSLKLRGGHWRVAAPQA